MIEYISEKLIKEIINKRIKGKNDEWMNEWIKWIKLYLKINQ